MTPIYSTERKRKGGLGGLVSVGGSGYNYYQVQVSSTTTPHGREEQREVKTLRSGLELFGDWVVINQW